MINVRTEIDEKTHGKLIHYCKRKHLTVKECLYDFIINGIGNEVVRKEYKIYPDNTIYTNDLNKLVNIISEITNIDTTKIISASRKSDVTLARHIFVFYATLITNVNRTILARYLSRDHATIINSLKWYAANKKYLDVKSISEKIEKHYEIDNIAKQYILSKYSGKKRKYNIDDDKELTNHQINLRSNRIPALGQLG